MAAGVGRASETGARALARWRPRRGRLACGLVIGAVELTALVLAVTSARPFDVDARDAALAVVLMGAGVVTGLLARLVGEPDHVEDEAFITLNGCWVVPAALLLPLPLLVPVGFLIQALSATAQRRVPFNVRTLFSYSLAGLTAWCAGVVGGVLLPDPLHASLSGAGSTTVLALIAVVAVHLAFDMLMVAAVWLRFRELSWGQARGERLHEAVDVALLMLGALLAVVMSADPAYVLLALPVPLVLQRLTWVQALRSRAEHDDKTGLLNVGAWMTTAERATIRAHAAGEPVAVLLVDLDHFKAVNDLYGHLSGDVVLRATADAMAAAVRDDDVLGRFGGEEFVALLPGATPAVAVAVAERVRQALQALRVPVDGATIRVTASVGVSSALDDNGLLGLMRSADRALYDAKRGGRNRVHAPHAAVLAPPRRSA